jgi:hypothetical protein
LNFLEILLSKYVIEVNSSLNDEDTPEVPKEDTTWIDRHEALVDEEIRVYLAAHKGDQYDI